MKLTVKYTQRIGPLTSVAVSSELADELFHIDFSNVSISFQATHGEVRRRQEDDKAFPANDSTTRQN